MLSNISYYNVLSEKVVVKRSGVVDSCMKHEKQHQLTLNAKFFIGNPHEPLAHAWK
jgi:hypothetical protein